MPVKSGNKDRVLAQLVARSGGPKNMPTGRINRLWQMGSSHAKIFGNFLAYGLRKNFINADRQEKLRNETNLKAALTLLDSMSYLRGALMKFGQWLATPNLVSEEFCQVLASLQFQAPAMHYAMIRQVFWGEFGKEPNEIFANFEQEAFAAASLGQVHRARLKNGKEVAVKIQYPAIGRAIKADVSNFRLLIQPMRLHPDWQFLCRHLVDFEKMLGAEIDYEQEASFQEQIHQLFFNDPDIIIPAIHHEYSRKRVITMDYLPGQHLPDYLARKPELRERNLRGRQISQAMMRIWYQTRTIYPDIHLGNFLFMADGRLGILDFGSHRRFSEDEWFQQNINEQALLHGDTKLVNQGIVQNCFFDSLTDIEPSRHQHLKETLAWIAEPAGTVGSFDFGDQEYHKQGMALIRQAMQKGYQRHESFHNWTTKFFLGFRSILYQLDCQLPYQELYQIELAQAPDINFAGQKIPLASLYQRSTEGLA
jgi:aarF domain-containing kinase